MNGIHFRQSLGCQYLMLDARLVAFGYPASTFVQQLSKTKYMNRKTSTSDVCRLGAKVPTTASAALVTVTGSEGPDRTSHQSTTTAAHQ